MTEREIKTAKHFNCLALTENIERELLKLPDVVGVEFDLNGMEYNQFIVLTKYDIPVSAPLLHYFRRREKLVNNVIDLMRRNGFHKTEDRVEDYGEHFYFVFHKMKG